MRNVIIIIISIFVVLYIINKRPPTSLKLKKEMKDNLNESNYIDVLSENIISNIQEINPLKSDYVWTYVEVYDKPKNHPLLYKNYSVIPYFIECIKKMKQTIPNLIVITPLNIDYYLPNFSLIMSPESPIPLKKRVDILFAMIIKHYGGLCISPGTIVYNIEPFLNQLKRYELITIGNNDLVQNNYKNPLYPNNYIIGGKKNTNFFIEYSRKLMQSTNNQKHFDLYHKSSTEILSDVLQMFYKELDENDDFHYHFNPDYDGTYDKNMKSLTLDDYLGTYRINFKNSEKLAVISFPYEELSKNIEYRWFRTMKDDDFKKSNLEIKRLLMVI